MSKNGKGNNNEHKNIASKIKNGDIYCRQCFLSIGPGEKRTKTVCGYVHDNCLHKIILTAFKKAGLSRPRISISPKATLEENFSVCIQAENLDAAGRDLCNKMHEDFFGSPVNIYGITPIKKIAKTIFEFPMCDSDIAYVAAAHKWKKIFGQSVDLSKLRHL